MNRPVYWDARFKDLPLLTSKPAPMDDEAIRFHSDIQYMNLLLDDIAAFVVSGVSQRQPTFEWLGLHDELMQAGREMANIGQCLDAVNAWASMKIAGWQR
jgi:hypothetical protein